MSGLKKEEVYEVLSIASPGFTSVLIKMVKSMQSGKNNKFNVKIDLPEIYMGKNRPPAFSKIFEPQFINQPLNIQFDIVQFKHIVQSKKEIVIMSAEEVI